MQAKSQSNYDYALNHHHDRLDEKLMQSAAVFLLKISKAAESLIVTDTKH